MSGKDMFFCDLGERVDVSQLVSVEALDPSDDAHPLPVSGKWVDRADEELRRQGDLALGRPLWRVLLLVGKTSVVCVFSFNHAIGDGLSGVTALRNLLQFLDERNAAGTPSTVTSAGLTPELRGALGTSLTKKIAENALMVIARFPRLVALIEPAWVFLPHLFEGADTPRPVPAAVPAATSFVRRGTPEGFAWLRAACKERGATMGGFVAAVLMFIGAAVDPAAPREQPPRGR